MPIFTISISISDISTVYSTYNKARVYRSITGLEADRVLYDVFDLFETQSVYSWVDSEGDSSYSVWFTYYNSYTEAEGSFSSAIFYADAAVAGIQGFSFSDKTYPDELSISSEDQDILYDIRLLIGDLKTVKRDYVSSDCFETYDNVLPDYATYKLSEPPGWPLKISLDSQSYTNTSNPSVNGYEFLTFSGVQINTVTGTLDVWYEHFRFSDKDIFKTYSAAEPPPPLTSTTVTEKVLKLVSAISLLQAELRSLAANTTGSFNLQGELSYNPDPVLKARKKDLEDLKDKLEEEIEDIIGNTVTGVRVD